MAFFIIPPQDAAKEERNGEEDRKTVKEREDFAKCSDPQLQPEGLEESPSLCKDCITIHWTAAGPHQLTFVRACVCVRESGAV